MNSEKTVSGHFTSGQQNYPGEVSCEQTLGSLHSQIESTTEELHAVASRIDEALHGIGPSPEPNLKEVRMEGTRHSAERSSISLNRLLDRLSRIANRL